jgi:DNA polymerase-3 subunit gamma/tau
MSQALYRKWRPARFDQIVGQEHVTRTLRNAVSAGRTGHAYLFCGPRGTGKTTTARLLAKAVNCLHEDLDERPCNTCANCRAITQGRFLDLIEIDAASNTGVDDIRDLRDKINFSPGEGRFKVYIVDEVHMLSTAAFNALLKTLEEPPPHAKFVLATTEEHKVPMTIKSRCQQFNFRLLTQPEIVGRLQWIAEQEDLTIDPQALELIARQGAGSIRDAESLLDQLVTAPGDAISLERTQMVLGTASGQAVSDLVDAWLAGDGPTGLQTIHEALASGADVRQFARQMVEYLRQVLLLQAGGHDVPLTAPQAEQARMRTQAQQSSREALIEAVKAFNEAALAGSSSWQPRLPLELAFIGLLPDRAAATPATSDPAGRPAASPKTEAPPEARQAEAADDVAPAEDTAPAGEERPARVAESEKDAPATAAADDAVTLAAVKRTWDQMVSRVGQEDKNLPALLGVCTPLAVEGNAIVLGFEYPVLKDKFEDRPQTRELVASTLSELIGHKCRVHCVVSGEYTPPPAPATPDPADDSASEVDRDAFYALADELGGRVHET